MQRSDRSGGSQVRRVTMSPPATSSEGLGPVDNVLAMNQPDAAEVIHRPVHALVLAAPASSSAPTEDLCRRLAAEGLDVEVTTPYGTARHPWLRSKQQLVLTTASNPREAARVAVHADVPLVLPGLDTDAISDSCTAVRLVAHSVLVVHLDHRPAYLALADCVVTVDDVQSVLRFDVDSGRFVARAPAVRVATADPLSLVRESRCQHTGRSTMIGLSWNLDQPDADRMIRRRSRVGIVGVDGADLTVRCDGGRMVGAAHHVRVGPNRRLRLGLIAP